MRKIDLNACFSCDSLLIRHLTLQGAEDTGSVCAPDEHYVFDLNTLNEILLYLAKPLRDCLYISGPSGCGKTTIVHQTAARLKWGLEHVTLSGKSEVADLIGRDVLRHGDLHYEYGPLVRAMTRGRILLLNEVDMMPPAELSALNDILEGKALTVIGNSSEVIRPHPDFRVIATANTKGTGDEMGFYNGARMLNQAFLDRWRFVEMGYPSVRAESVMIRENCPGLSSAVADGLLRLATELRRVSSPGESQGEAQLSSPFSTRVLLRIASLLELTSEISVQKAVDMGYAARLPKVEREYVQRLCCDIMGYAPAAGTAKSKRSRRGRDPEQLPDDAENGENDASAENAEMEMKASA